MKREYLRDRLRPFYVHGFGGVRLREVVMLVIAIATAAGCSPSEGAAPSQRFTIQPQVWAAKWSAIRLRNLPEGASLMVSMHIDGPVTISLLDEENFERFSGDYTPLFEGETSETLEFALVLPKSGTYYVVIDNRANDDPRHARLDIEAHADAAHR
jgi:hypothetical protein